MGRVSGVATGRVRRRRRFNKAFKLDVVRRTLEPGASIAGIALEHRLNANMLFKWRRQYLRALAPASTPKLLPVVIEDRRVVASPRGAEALPPAVSLADAPAVRGSIEIDAYGVRIVLNGTVDGKALRTVLAALSGR